eukprot:COSAG06_NODE_10749_length_1623_cov_144.574803_3_plen_42_part_00
MQEMRILYMLSIPSGAASIYFRAVSDAIFFSLSLAPSPTQT